VFLTVSIYWMIHLNFRFHLQMLFRIKRGWLWPPMTRTRWEAWCWPTRCEGWRPAEKSSSWSQTGSPMLWGNSVSIPSILLCCRNWKWFVYFLVGCWNERIIEVLRVGVGSLWFKSLNAYFLLVYSSRPVNFVLLIPVVFAKTVQNIIL